jgi:hypothetical protein
MEPFERARHTLGKRAAARAAVVDARYAPTEVKISGV